MKGFTLIEILVALVIFEFGMLALAATSAVTARELGVANRRARAQLIARNRVELLRASACQPVSGGTSEIRGGLKEYWRVDADGARRVITDSVEFAVEHGRVAGIVVRGYALCAT